MSLGRRGGYVRRRRSRGSEAKFYTSQQVLYTSLEIGVVVDPLAAILRWASPGCWRHARDKKKMIPGVYFSFWHITTPLTNATLGLHRYIHRCQVARDSSKPIRLLDTVRQNQWSEAVLKCEISKAYRCLVLLGIAEHTRSLILLLQHVSYVR